MNKSQHKKWVFLFPAKFFEAKIKGKERLNDQYYSGHQYYQTVASKQSVLPRHNCPLTVFGYECKWRSFIWITLTAHLKGCVSVHGHMPTFSIERRLGAITPPNAQEFKTLRHSLLNKLFHGKQLKNIYAWSISCFMKDYDYILNS